MGRTAGGRSAATGRGETRASMRRRVGRTLQGLELMAPNPTHGLTLTAAQADYLLRLVTIAELAIGEHSRTGWLPTGLGDATLMRTHLQASGAPCRSKRRCAILPRGSRKREPER